jgi:hypothetical protein
MPTILENFSKQIENFLLLLTQKERFVVERRFNLDRKEKATLEEIGQHYSVTRERIRQIEKNALNKLKRNLENAPLVSVSNFAYDMIAKAGGVAREDFLISKLIENNPEYSVEALQLVLSIDKRFNRIPNTVNFYPYLKLATLSQNDLESVCRQAVDVLKKQKNTMSTAALLRTVAGNKNLQLDENMFNSLVQIDKKIKYINSEAIGLVDWRHINPRTLRDKIFYILRNSGQPMHFVDIANKIIEFNFDRKKINLQAVHNELIRHDDFILIGRGIYGLKEWGFSAGTVADVIANLLKHKESMSQEEIIEEVLKQRKVKPITIILSLKNKKQFVRVGRKQYSLRMA